MGDSPAVFGLPQVPSIDGMALGAVTVAVRTVIVLAGGGESRWYQSYTSAPT